MLVSLANIEFSIKYNDILLANLYFFYILTINLISLYLFVVEITYSKDIGFSFCLTRVLYNVTLKAYEERLSNQKPK